MTPEPVRGSRVRLIADPGLVGEEEARAVVYLAAGIAGCLLGLAVSRWLGVL